MSLSLRGVNPYLKEAIGWIQQVVDAYGGSSILFSGFRTKREQQAIWDDCQSRGRITKLPFPQLPCGPVAQPGCSQHQYGFAVDAGFFGPATGVGTFPDWTGYAQDLGKHYWGLHQVSGDPGHFQMYTATEFLPWVRTQGECLESQPRLAIFPGNYWQGLPPDALDYLYGTFIPTVFRR